MALGKEPGAAAQKAISPLMRLFLYDYCAYTIWMRSSGSSKSVSSAFASFSLTFYIAWVLIGLASCFLPPMKELTTYRIASFPATTVVVILAWCVLQNWSTRFLRAREDIALSIYAKYKAVSYIKVVAAAALLLVPLPLALAAARGNFPLICLALASHGIYLVSIGGFLLRQIESAPNVGASNVTDG